MSILVHIITHYMTYC